MTSLPQPSFSRRSFLGAGSAAAVLVAGGATAESLFGATLATAAPGPKPVLNPIVSQRADPWLMKHTDNRYYFTGSVPEYDRIIVRSASSISGLGSAAETVVWKRPASGTMGGHIWAPELHHFDGKWHIYFAAGDSNDVFRVRIYVISTDSSAFLQRRGLSDSAAFSFESVDIPGSYLCLNQVILTVSKVAAGQKAAATFKLAS